MSNHRFDIVHQNSERPLSSHAISHNIQNLENCFSLKGIFHCEPNPEYNTNLLNLRNSEIAHQLILKSRQPDGLNIRQIHFPDFTLTEFFKLSLPSCTNTLNYRCSNLFMYTDVTLFKFDLYLYKQLYTQKFLILF